MLTLAVARAGARDPSRLDPRLLYLALFGCAAAQLVYPVAELAIKAPVLVGLVDDGPTGVRNMSTTRWLRPFVDRVIVPLVSAVWSADPSRMGSFPARFMATFLDSHGLLAWVTARNAPTRSPAAKPKAPAAAGHPSSTRTPTSSATSSNAASGGSNRSEASPPVTPNEPPTTAPKSSSPPSPSGSAKHRVELHDYVDTRIAILDRMHANRLPAFSTLGFPTPSARGDADPPRHLPASDPMLSDDLEDVENLGELVELITVDAYGDEGYWSFLQVFEDHVSFPFTASLVGAPIVVTAADFDGDERRGLIVTVEREGTKATISLLDLDLAESPAPTGRLVAAYRRWLGIG